MSEYNTDGNGIDAQPADEMPPLGAVLRAARESRGESLSDVAMTLKLSVRQLEAIEQERFAELPGPAFVKGFVRNYGRHLGVDVEPMVTARWGTGASVIELTPMTNADGILPASGEPSRLRRFIAPLVLVLVIGGGLAWYFDGFDPNPGSAETEPSTEASADGPSESEAEGFPPPLDASTDADEPLSQEPTPVLPPSVDAPVVLPLPEQLLQPESATVEPPPPPVASEVSPPQQSAGESDAEVTSGPGRLVFRLEQESWLEVRDNRDRRLYSGVGSAGSVRVVQGQPPFAVVIGNAAGVRLEHAGRSVELAPHTSSGGVARLKVE